ncbi:unnamed protein product [Enterobius vermicularis]|uniref:CUB domain-containing protein n=1 Tax=Enterobius vermicularis TaxID=51028 RepID=A0A0N4V4Y5_ENTVE|nr:unnamed protein product [Enterobius vermicularis]
MDANIGDTKCPGANNGTPVAIDGAILLFPDYYQEVRTRSYPKSCEWEYMAPASGWLTVLKVLDLVLSGNEILTVIGNINGTQSDRVFDRSYKEKAGVYYYDSELSIKYTRLSAVNSSAQAFRILLTTMKLENKTCSLAYNNRSYSDLNGSFTNVRTRLQYPKNEYCTWSVTVPGNATLVFCCVECNYGHLSGDRLKISVGEIEYIDETEKGNHYCSSSNWTDYCVTMNKSLDGYDVKFEWESDGLAEYNGFQLEYFISIGDKKLNGQYRWMSSSSILFSCLLLIYRYST